MGSYDNANLNLCETLYAGAGQTPPYYAYHHSAAMVPGENCGSGGDAVAGLAFYPGSGGSYPAAYAGALFFADNSRGRIWAMRPSTPGGLPDPTNLRAFGQAAASPVDLAIGPGAELYYADLGGGTVRRIRYFPGNQPPTAVIQATPTSGPAPLDVTFDGTGSTDPDPADAGRLSYRWDFTGDGTVDATTPTATFRYPTAGNHTARLTVTDTLGVSASSTVTIQPGNATPTAVLDSPVLGTTWRVGDTWASPAGPPTRSRATCRRRRCAGGCGCSTASRSATATPTSSRSGPGWPPDPSSRRTTSTRRTWNWS